MKIQDSDRAGGGLLVLIMLTIAFIAAQAGAHFRGEPAAAADLSIDESASPHSHIPDNAPANDD